MVFRKGEWGIFQKNIHSCILIISFWEDLLIEQRINGGFGKVTWYSASGVSRRMMNICLVWVLIGNISKCPIILSSISAQELLELSLLGLKYFQNKYLNILNNVSNFFKKFVSHPRGLASLKRRIICLDLV